MKLGRRIKGISLATHTGSYLQTKISILQISFIANTLLVLQALILTIKLKNILNIIHKKE